MYHAENEESMSEEAHVESEIPNECCNIVNLSSLRSIRVAPHYQGHNVMTCVIQKFHVVLKIYHPRRNVSTISKDKARSRLRKSTSS